MNCLTCVLSETCCLFFLLGQSNADGEAETGRIRSVSVLCRHLQERSDGELLDARRDVRVLVWASRLQWVKVPLHTTSVNELHIHQHISTRSSSLSGSTLTTYIHVCGAQTPPIRDTGPASIKSKCCCRCAAVKVLHRCFCFLSHSISHLVAKEAQFPIVSSLFIYATVICWTITLDFGVNLNSLLKTPENIQEQLLLCSVYPVTESETIGIYCILADPPDNILGVFSSFKARWFALWLLYGMFRNLKKTDGRSLGWKDFYFSVKM